MRCYTQNIDGLEKREGLSMDLTYGKGTKKRFMKKIWDAPRPTESRNSDADGGCEVVPLHGDLEVLRCTLCHETCPWTDEATEDFLSGFAPECTECAIKSCDRQERGKRGVAVGSLRPNIVLYGEDHPSNQLLAPIIPFDLSSGPEILIIMGTSLKVHGLQRIVREFAKKIHDRKDGKGRVIFVNRTKPAESVWENVIDSYVAMDCDDWVHDLRRRREDLFLRQGELSLKVTKPMAKKRKSEEIPSTPSKRAKSSVEIPNTRTPSKSKVVREEPDQTLMTPPPSRGRRSEQPSSVEPQAPHNPSNNGFSFKRNMYDNIFKRLLGSPVRPDPSPIRNTWKHSSSIRGAEEGSGGVSPERPSVFSPIEERRGRGRRRGHRKWWVYEDEDADVEIEESQDEEGEGNGKDNSVPGTPTRKGKVLGPRSASRMNMNITGGMVNEKVKRPGTEMDDDARWSGRRKSISMG